MKKKAVSLFLALAIVLSLIPWGAVPAEAVSVNGFGDTSVIKSTDHTIAPGVTETNVILNDSTGDAQVMGYMLTIDLSKAVTLKAS